MLSFAKADETRVNIASGWAGNTRFAGNEITTSGGTTDTNVTVTSTIGKRRASATTNVLDDESLKRTVAFAESLARLEPRRSGDRCRSSGRRRTRPSTATSTRRRTSPPRRARPRRSARSTPPRRRGKRRATCSSPDSSQANAGAQRDRDEPRTVRVSSQQLDADLSTTARTPDGTGSGWASGGARDWSAIDPAALGRVAAQKAVASRNPKAIEPGLYTVVLEPQAVADLMPQLVGAFNARANDEGRGTFSKPGGGTKLGEKIADERVTIFSDPADPRAPRAAVRGRRLAAPARRLHRERHPQELLVRSLLGAEAGEDADDRRRWRSVAVAVAEAVGGGGGGLKFVGGTKTTDELIAGTERGILVTHFFYIRSLDQRTVLLTGLTRDGTFLIENGKITQALKNFRWNESPLFLLNKIEEIGRAERTNAGQVMPSIRAKDFNFSSLSDAV